MSHTPGPYVVVFQKKPSGNMDIGIAPCEDSYRWIARVASNPQTPFEEDLANAKMLAAAPILFDVLEAVLEEDDGMRISARIREVLKLARGES